MMGITMIAAIGRRGELGKDNKLLWHIPEDFRWFKDHTMGKNIVMGRNTFESIGRPLPNRRTFLLSRDKELEVGGTKVISHPGEILNMVEDFGEEFTICGGGGIYDYFLPYADKLIITHVDAEFDADVFFPEFDRAKYTKTQSEKLVNYDGTPYELCIYEK